MYQDFGKQFLQIKFNNLVFLIFFSTTTPDQIKTQQHQTEMLAEK